MQLNPSEISELLKQRIEGMGLNTNLRTEGTAVSYTHLTLPTTSRV